MRILQIRISVILAIVSGIIIPGNMDISSYASSNTQANHVLLFVLEGVGNEAIHKDTMPVIKKLAKEGAVSWEAQSVSPALPVPAMASLLTGVPVTKHRINKEWETYDFSRSFLRSPTIFDYLDLAGGQDTAVFFMDERFYQLSRPEIYVDSQTCGKAKPECNPITLVTYIKDYLKKVTNEGGYGFRLFTLPGLLMVHLPEGADTAKRKGWDSKAYQKALVSVDTAIGNVIQIYKDFKALDESMVIVTSLTSPATIRTLETLHQNGSKTPGSVIVPWLAWGANIKPAYQIKHKVSIMDTGATILEALGLETYTEWDSQTLHEIFQRVPKRRTTGNEAFLR